MQGGDGIARRVSKTGIKGKRLVGAVNADARFGVFPNAFLKEVCFALKANCFHPFEWVPSFEVTVAAKAEEESVGAEFDVVTHCGGIHSN